MATFTNTTDADLEVQIDGRRIDAPAGASFDVPDEFADQLRSQPNFVENVSAEKSTKSTPTPEPTPAAADKEGDN